jgi:hypothetical protein
MAKLGGAHGADVSIVTLMRELPRRSCTSFGWAPSLSNLQFWAIRSDPPQ